MAKLVSTLDRKFQVSLVDTGDKSVQKRNYQLFSNINSIVGCKKCANDLVLFIYFESNSSQTSETKLHVSTHAMTEKLLLRQFVPFLSTANSGVLQLSD